MSELTVIQIEKVKIPVKEVLAFLTDQLRLSRDIKPSQTLVDYEQTFDGKQQCLMFTVKEGAEP